MQTGEDHLFGNQTVLHGVARDRDIGTRNEGPVFVTVRSLGIECRPDAIDTGKQFSQGRIAEHGPAFGIGKPWCATIFAQHGAYR